MRSYYEDLWSRLPDGAEAPGAGRRRRFLLERVRPGTRLLDLGCGLGHDAAAAAAAGAEVVAAELARAAVERARAAHPGLDVRLIPEEGPLPFADGEFELVWSAEVIEHVADTAAWLSEVRRVLAPRGRLLLTTPDSPRLRVAVLGMSRMADPLGEHLRFYTRRSLRSLLEEFGFEEARVRGAGGLPGWRSTLLAEARRASWRSRAAGA